MLTQKVTKACLKHTRNQGGGLCAGMTVTDDAFLPQALPLQPPMVTQSENALFYFFFFPKDYITM